MGGLLEVVVFALIISLAPWGLGYLMLRRLVKKLGGRVVRVEVRVVREEDG